MISPINDFYSQKTIFITGGTGFVGKVLIEKLLRSCNGIQTIYILIRDRKGKTTEQRWNDYISDEVFTYNKLEIGRKLVPINGNMSEPNLGISETDRLLLINNVNIVIHLASYLKWEPPFKDAIKHNLMGTISLVELCRQIKHLDVLVYVSTIAVQCSNDDTKEMVYPTPLSPEHAIETCQKCTDRQIRKYVKIFFPKYPNVYSLSKSMAEQFLYKESKNNMNIVIIRPSAINPSYSEPIPGWVFGKHGPTFVLLLSSVGIMRIAQFNYKARIGQIPVDYVSNAIIASAWYTTTHRSNELQVFHLTSQHDNTPTFKELIDMNIKNLFESPSKRILRPPSLNFFKNKYRLKLETFIKHWLFAAFFDLMAKIIGNKSRVSEVTRLMQSNMYLVKFWVNNEREFEVTNTEHLIEQMSDFDRNEFYFDVRHIDWEYYYKNIWMGMRRHLLKEKDEEIPKAKRRLKRIIFNYRILMGVWYTFIGALLYLIAIIFIRVFNIKLLLYFDCLTSVWFIAIPISICSYIAYKLIAYSS